MSTNPSWNEHSVVEYAKSLDAIDPLRRFLDEFVIDDPDLIYLDGNSLGRLPIRTMKRMEDAVRDQWGGRLVRGWGEHWIDLPNRLGAKIAQLIGAQPDEVLVCDSTSVNFYKLIMAALEVQSEKSEILTDDANFPSDIYLLQGCAKQLSQRLKIVPQADVASSLSFETAIVTLSHTSFKSGYVHPIQELTAKAHEVGALMLWDLSHSVGAMPIDLNGSNVDLAVGCTYKYLNGGPGAPAFLYVRRDLQEKLLNPIWGWFGQKDPFGFSLDYRPADGIQRFMAGTPNILSMIAIESGVDLLLEAGMDRIREKSVRQTEFLIQMWDNFLRKYGVALNSPTDSVYRGSHVSFGHPQAFQVDQALIEEMKVIPDFRQPDNIRFGVTPLSTRFEDLAQAVLRMSAVFEQGIYQKYPEQAKGVT